MSKKHTFDIFKISYLSQIDAKKVAEKHELPYYGDETCLFIAGCLWFFEPVFSLKGNHYENLMNIKRETKNLEWKEQREIRTDLFLNYLKNNKHLEIQ
jgi:hypothetical protein